MATLHQNPCMKGHYIFIALLLSTIGVAQTYTDVTPISAINTDVGDSYPWISPDGLRLYYTSGPGSFANQIYLSQRADANSDFSAPVQLGIGNVTGIVSIWLTDDEKDAYLTTVDGKLFFAHRDNTMADFANPAEIALTGFNFSLFKGPSLNDAQTQMFLTSGGQIHELVRTSPTSFAYLNTIALEEATANPGQLSKDELSFFFTATGFDEIGKMGRLVRESVDLPFTGSSYVEVGGVNDPAYSSLQPSLSANLEWLVFVKNNDGSWTGNDIYIAHNGNLAITENQANHFTIHPNPANGVVYLSGNRCSENCMIELWDLSGKRLFRKPFAAQLDLGQYAKGTYLLKVHGSNFSETQKLVLR